MDLFERLLREKIALMIDMRVEAVTLTGATSFEEYKQQLGYLDALRHILEACDEINNDMRNK